MENVTVLGGTGFLGRHVVRAFERRGSTVTSCSRAQGVDARNEAALRAFLEKQRTTLLVNCAAHGGGIAYNAQNAVAIYEDNLVLGYSTVRAATGAGVRKLANIMGNSTYPGKMDVYAESAWWDGAMDSSVMASGMPRKAQWVQAWAHQLESGFRSIHLVLPNMYGPGDHLDPQRSHALAALIRKIWEAKEARAAEVEIWGTGNAIREWLYVEDAAEGIVRAAERYEDINILNLGRGEGCSIRELATTIAEMLEWRGRFVFNTARPDGAPRKVFDVTRMRQSLDWAPPTTLREGLRKTIAWFRAKVQPAARARLASASCSD